MEDKEKEIAFCYNALTHYINRLCKATRQTINSFKDINTNTTYTVMKYIEEGLNEKQN